MNKDITNTTLLMIAELAGEHTMSDGSKLQITVVEQAGTETEVSAKFEDCFAKVRPMVFPNLTTFIPTERNAKQLQAFAKLLVIMHDLNGGEWIPEKEWFYTIWYGNSCFEVLDLGPESDIDSPVYFRTSELAKKALEANEQIFRDFYGI